MYLLSVRETGHVETDLLQEERTRRIPQVEREHQAIGQLSSLSGAISLEQSESSVLWRSERTFQKKILYIPTYLS